VSGLQMSYKRLAFTWDSVQVLVGGISRDLRVKPVGLTSDLQ
jgi:hypothetical protein